MLFPQYPKFVLRTISATMNRIPVLYHTLSWRHL